MGNEPYKFNAQFIRRTYPKVKPQPGDWQVVKMRVMGKDKFRMTKEITLVGNIMVNMDTKSVYEVIAEKGFHPKYGENYNVKFIKEIREFKTDEQRKSFLKLFLNERQIDSLYKITNNPIELLENKDIETLCKSKGIGEKTAKKMIRRYDECKTFSVSYQKMLIDYDLSEAVVRRMVKQYNDSPDLALAKLEENPYNLTEVDGIGFLKADEIALKLGVDELDSRRIQGFISYYLEEVGNSYGHSYVYYDDVLNNVEEYLSQSIDQTYIDDQIQNLIDNRKIWFKETEDDNVIIASRRVVETEKSISCHLKRLIKGKNNITLNGDMVDTLVKPQEKKQGWNFTERQKEGIKKIMKHNVVIIRGYGGTGKSSTVAGVLSCLRSYTFHQCALSGKASVNLRDITGQDGSTIHSLLGFSPSGGYTYNEGNQLNTQMVILDEASMPNIYLLNSLLKAIPTGAKLVLLGDTNQLEPIGVGNALLDMIESGVIPTVTFDEIHRQSAKSGIIPFSIDVAKGTTQLKDGWFGEKTLGTLQDFKLIGYQYDREEELPRPSAGYILDNFIDLYEECHHDISQLSVILPTKKGAAGCVEVNNMVQEYVLPQEEDRGDFIKIRDYKIYKGDKVINTQNKYDIEPKIFNGNMGEVIEVNSEEQELIINFYNIGIVTLTGRDMIDSIELGYAITTHKSQGSTIPYVISCIDYTHYTMLNRQQVYTMITRAKKKEVFIFETRALNRAIRTNNATQRRTFLYFFLRGEL
mgnify:CR=1 FL=1